jgi:hypothetical protein
VNCGPSIAPAGGEAVATAAEDTGMTLDEFKRGAAGKLGRLIAVAGAGGGATTRG